MYPPGGAGCLDAGDLGRRAKTVELGFPGQEINCGRDGDSSAHGSAESRTVTGFQFCPREDIDDPRWTEGPWDGRRAEERDCC